MDRKRRDSLARLDPKPGERLLIVGAGTGADLPHLPAGCTVLATDLTPAMLRRARPRAREHTHLVVMDGQQLAVPDGAFDGVVLHLILAVIPTPCAACARPPGRCGRAGAWSSSTSSCAPAGPRSPSAPSTWSSGSCSRT